MPTRARSWVRAGLAVAARPSLWRSALRQAVRLARPRWWRRPPFLPVPDRSYVGFRLETQYGAADARPTADDVVAYLRWCRALDRLVEQRRRGGGQEPQ
jgi:hypothetical protein